MLVLPGWDIVGRPMHKSPCVYQLLIRLAVLRHIRIGRLGRFTFPAGYYVYTGSARCHLEARLARHLRRAKKPHWHIDYLLAASGVRVVGVRRLSETECTAAGQVKGLVLVPGFGSSDCRAGCGSHLKYVGSFSLTRPCGFSSGGGLEQEEQGAWL